MITGFCSREARQLCTTSEAWIPEGKVPEISPVTFAFEMHGGRWETITEDTFDVRTDGRGVLSTPLGPVILGGMLKNGAASARVLVLPKK